ncbi:hypothetical protein BDZ94DRAFT_511820 [Collybia nuda]|uniref:Uncharacterized protein n=1 Tax=Collybia nuda TaxID=64659 RepID=A0A9P5XUC5_9AGAR|nr:hypothetical protein BDZ94DRAFT_511820 [Collybia nuda]
MDVDVNDHPPTSRIPPSPSSRKPNDEAGPRAGSGMYADREGDPAGDAPPRGPRAMAKPSVSTPGSGYASHSISPTTPFGYGPNAGNRPRDRSPPLHIQGRPNDGNARREHEFDQYAHPMERGPGRREPRPRSNDYPRPPPPGYPKLSGTNSVPIGNNRKPVVLGAPPPGKTYILNAGPPPGISTANMEPVRGMRGRGAPPQHKESYERPSYNEKPPVDYRPGRSENGASRQQDNSPMVMEPRQLSPVNPINAHDNHRGRRDGGYMDRGNQGRYNQVSALDAGRAPRTWTPREPDPPPARDLSRPRYDQHRAITPPIPSELPPTPPTWTPREMARQYEDLSIHQRDRVPPKSDSRPMQHRDGGPAPGRERFEVPDVRRSGSLEGRLSEPYKERHPEPVRQQHALPPNPALHRGHNVVHPETHWKEGRHEPGPIHPGWGEPREFPSHRSSEVPSSRTFTDQARGDTDMRGGRMPRIRRPQSASQLSGNSSLRMDMDIDDQTAHLSQEYEAQRPEILRRGGSLLDRLSLDQNGDTPVDGPPQSLRDRVQVPSKRDREEMTSDRHSHMMDTSFEDDGYDPNKKARRRSGKVRKVRRGGPP